MRRINLFSYGMMSLLKLFARVLVIVLAVSLFQQAHSAQAVPVRPPHFDRRAMPEALAAPVRSQELRILKASISPIKRDDKERAHE